MTKTTPAKSIPDPLLEDHTTIFHMFTVDICTCILSSCIYVCVYIYTYAHSCMLIRLLPNVFGCRHTHFMYVCLYTYIHMLQCFYLFICCLPPSNYTTHTHIYIIYAHRISDRYCNVPEDVFRKRRSKYIQCVRTYMQTYMPAQAELAMFACTDECIHGVTTRF